MNCFSLDGKVIIITGAAGLLGRMHAKAVLDVGAIPILLDINIKKLDSVRKELLEENPSSKVITFCNNITDENQMREVLDCVIEKCGHVDGLINNACHNPTMKNAQKGIGRLETLSHKEWLEDTEVGLYGAICCSKIFGGYMAEHDGGVILNIVSDLGVIAPNQGLYRIDGELEKDQPKKPVTYSTVKWGMIGLTKYLSTYWAEQNVRTNAVALGGVFNQQSEIFLKRIKEQIPMRRMARVDEYKGSIVYMLSEASSYMTGAVVSIDGGRTAW